VPKNRGICGIAVLKSTVKATVLVPWKWYRGAAVVPLYRATLVFVTELNWKKVENLVLLNVLQAT